MQVIKEVSMLLELKLKDLQAIKLYQSTIISKYRNNNLKLIILD
jgi:hypothetical protein